MQNQQGRKLKLYIRHSNSMERNRQKYSMRDRVKNDTSSWFKTIRHRAMYLEGITATTRTIRCTSCGKCHEYWNKHIYMEMRKIPAIMAKNSQTETDERDHNSQRERKNTRLHTRMGIPRHKKRRKSTQQRTNINAHATHEATF